MDRSSHQRCSVRKGVLRNFTKFTGKQLCWRPEACNFIKKEALTQVFACEFCEIYKGIFFTEHLWITASEWNNTQCFNPLIVWNDPFRVDEPYTEKPVG